MASSSFLFSHCDSSSNFAICSVNRSLRFSNALKKELLNRGPTHRRMRSWNSRPTILQHSPLRVVTCYIALDVAERSYILPFFTSLWKNDLTVDNLIDAFSECILSFDARKLPVLCSTRSCSTAISLAHSYNHANQLVVKDEWKNLFKTRKRNGVTSFFLAFSSIPFSMASNSAWNFFRFLSTTWIS